jgi:hypothetical protein
MAMMVLLLSVPAAAGADPALGQAGDGGTVDAAAAAQPPAAERKTGDVGAYSSILQRGLFGEAGGPSSGGSPAPASSSYRLVGTLESGGFAGAVFDDGAGVQTFYRIGQKLPDDSQLVQVRSDRVLVKRPDGTLNELFTADDAKAPPRPAAPPDRPVAGPAINGGASPDGQASQPGSRRRRSSRADD